MLFFFAISNISVQIIHLDYKVGARGHIFNILRGYFYDFVKET